MNKIIEILNKYEINGFKYPGGTDKGSDHSYDEYYSSIFKPFIDKEIKLLEIGIQYGGSALLWQELFPKGYFVLMDIVDIVHTRIWDLMDKNKYEFIVKDAFNNETLDLLNEKYINGFDLIIEDGPHTLSSQIFTIKNYTKLLKKGGLLIIEDIQNIENCNIILKEINKDEFTSVEIIDLRNKKGRYDDILIVIKK